MKILYIANFHDGTGYSHAAIDYVLALDSVGLDVIPQNIKLNDIAGEVPDRLIELEKKPLTKPDVVIQHTLPHMFDYNGHIDKNIGLFFTETSNFKYSGWATRINTMDEAWVCCDQNKSACIDSGVNIKTNVIPIPTNIRKFQRSYDKLDLGDEYNDKFLFYTIGEPKKRKNLPALLKAFHLEFAPEEPVELVIKTTSVGIRGREDIEKICKEVKSGLKLYSSLKDYKQEKVIVDYWTQEKINQFHNTCNCFVSTSYAEAWCIPAFDAMGFGKTPIVNKCGGFMDYIDNSIGWLVNNIEEPVFGEIGTFKDLCTANENWWSININDLRSSMRECYMNEKTRKEKSISGMKKAYNYSYKNVGKLMKDFLENVHR